MSFEISLVRWSEKGFSRTNTGLRSRAPLLGVPAVVLLWLSGLFAATGGLWGPSVAGLRVYLEYSSLDNSHGTVID